MQLLGLFDLLAPHYLVGIDIPEEIQRYLSEISVSEFRSHIGPQAILYTGICSINALGGGTEVTQESPSGGRFRWNGLNMRFRMSVPRDGAAFINDVVNASNSGSLPQVAALLNDLRPTEPTGADLLEVSDYPGIKFRLELLVDALSFSLGDEWVPGMIHPVSRRVVRDTDPRLAGKPVEIRLSKVLLSYSQGDDDNNLNPQFRLESWGTSGFDAPHDLGVGEFIDMVPGIALHRSGSFAFSLDEVILDTSPASTPPAILEKFGVGEDWTGIYIKQFLLYYSNDQGVGFTLRLADALFGFDGKVTFEAELAVFPNIDVTIFSVTPRFYHGPERKEFRRGQLDDSVDSAPAGDPPGLVNLMQGDVLQLDIGGGTPPYTIEVWDGSTNRWDNAARQVVFNEARTYNIFIKVNDGRSPDRRRKREYIRVVVAPSATAAPPSGTTADRRPGDHPLPTLEFDVTSGNTGGHDLVRVRPLEPGTMAHFQVQGGGDAFTVTITPQGGGAAVRTIENQREFSIDVQEGSSFDIRVTYAALTPEALGLVFVNFTVRRPLDNAEVDRYVERSSGDAIFESGTNSWPAALNLLPAPETIEGIQIDGFASFDSANEESDQRLSARRATVLQRLLASHYSGHIPPITLAQNAFGQTLSASSNWARTDERNRTARITFTLVDAAQHTLTANVHRDRYTPPSGGGTTDPAPPVGNPPRPAEMPNSLPPAIKQLGIRIKVDQNELALLELYGSIDFETELEGRLRNGGSIPPGDGNTSWITQGSRPDGILNFKLIYQYDRGSDETAIVLQLFSDENDQNGLCYFINNANRDDRGANVVGALMLFGPIINSAAESAADNSQDAGSWVAVGLSLGVPIAIGGLGIFRTRRGILYGGEGRFKWIASTDGSLRRWDFALLLDYGVEFDIVVEALGIGQDRLPGAATPLPPPLRVRYKGFGINFVDGPGGLQYNAIFDQSKGYDLNLADPSLFRLPDPLGNLFSIVGARMARFNPLTLEIDFAIKVDLGVITVDRFKVKIPLDPPDVPQILPSGVRVNIPGVLIGNGYVNVIDTKVVDSNGNEIESKGIEGGLDLTLVSVKLRIAGNIAVGTIRDTATGREAIAVFVGLIVEFPTPIILGSSGMGLFGLSGLFAMHYRRLEEPRNPTEAVGPALKWLIKAEGEAYKLRNSASELLWGPEFDRWSFGVGAVLGSLEGGMLINFQGMFVLELPGPRILILVKIKMLSIDGAPKVSDDPNQLSLGIIGIIDLDFGRGTITIGVMINFEIEELLKLAIPIEIFFNLRNGSDWHFYLGTIAQPASAEILNIVRGSAYFMIQGYELKYADFGSRVPEFLRDKVLPGVALAAGIEASILLGDPGSIYLRISIGLHVGVAFSPFIIVGSMFLEGELRLIIVSIGARGTFNALISQRPDGSYNTYLQGEICGSVSFFFFSISACIGLEIGSEDLNIQPPALINGVYLQSYAPVLTSGQGSAQKPIDASLGNAWDPASLPDANPRPAPVPIDTVPVLQLRFAPEKAASLDANTFTDPILPAPGRPPGGWYQLSGDVELQYTLNSLTLTENGVAYPGERPPATWRLDRPHTPNGTDTAIDLALFSRVPTAAEYAVERSTELRENITVRWGNVCRRPAPPARVLYTFCNQPLGASMHGWRLRGTAWPDPQDTVRVELPITSMRVFSPEACSMPSTLDMFLAEWGMPYDIPATVIGSNNLNNENNLDKGNRQTTKCYDLILPERKFHPNPFRVEEALLIYSASTKGSIFDLGQGGFFDPEVFVKNSRYPLRTQMRDIENYRGISMREYMRIDVLSEPAQVLTLRFVSFNQKRSTLGVFAYNKAGELVDKDRWRPTSGKEIELVTLRVSAAEISHLIITNGYFTGLLLEICLSWSSDSGSDKTQREQCQRALRLPHLALKPLQRPNNPPPFDYATLVKYFEEKTARSCNYVTFDTGGCAEVRIFGAVHKKLPEHILLMECDQNGVVLATHVLSALPQINITNPLTELPTPWLQSGGAWRSRVVEASRLLFSGEFEAYDKIVLEIKPNPATRSIKINTSKSNLPIPSMYVALIETLTLSELAHHASVTETIQSDQETLTGYLNDNTPRPLLRPDSTYRLSANYTVIARHPERGEVYNQSHTQSFEFQTDNQAPAQLSPYVLGTIPHLEDKFHFFGEPLILLFNDPAVLRLVDAYGKQLRAVIRGADGAPVAQSPETLTSLVETPASVFSPYRDIVQALIEAGLFPCVGGSSTFTGHGRYTAPFELKPLTPYTFDFEYTVPDPVAPNQAITPLYRRAFQTSRFRNVQDFAESHQIYAIQHQALQVDLAGLPTGPAVGTATDIAIENALVAAGVPLSNETEKTGYTILWLQEVGDAHYFPYAILVDGAEPMWRIRYEPIQKAVLNEQLEVLDPAFVIYENQAVDHLVLRGLSGQNRIRNFVRSTAGTRTLVFLRKGDLPAEGEILTIEVVQTASELYGLAEQTSVLLEIQLSPKAPWEE